MSIVKLSVGVSGGNLERKHSINVEMDFTGVDPKQLLEWAADNRVIALQRVLRSTSDAYLTTLAKSTLKIHAVSCGSKIETPEERIKQLVAAGMPEKLARMSVENPTKFAELMASVGK